MRNLHQTAPVHEPSETVVIAEDDFIELSCSDNEDDTNVLLIDAVEAASCTW